MTVSLQRALLPLLVALALPWTAPAAIVRLEGDRLSVQADGEPLQAVLAGFARQGVRVKWDPTVSPTVTLDLRRRDAEEALQLLFASCDYMATWRQVQGPLGPLPVLEELQVFKPGRREAAVPLSGVATGAPPVRVREYMAGELLVRVSTNASPGQFLALVARYGGRVVDSIPSLGLYKLVFPPETDIPRLAQELARQAGMAAAEPNYVYRLPPALPASPASGGSGLMVSPAQGAGEPQVAVLDTGFGIENDPLMAWLDAAGSSPVPVDDHGHGTEMALLASGRIQPLGSPAAGDPQPVLAIRIASQGDFVAGDVLLRSLQAALEQKVRVVSLSWGSDMDSAFLKEVIDQAAARGMVIVAAAGNKPTGSPVYPAAFPNVLAVAGAGAQGQPADWSNYGDFISLAAPGYAPLPGKSGMVAAGTSVSTAYTANILARYFQLHPEATTAQAVKAVRQSLTRSGKWDDRYGPGLLDEAAVSRLLKLP